MSIRPEQSKLDKLPKWAADYITDVERERDVALRALNEYVDAQTVSAIYYDDILCLGENNRKSPSFKRKYVQTKEITFEHLEIEMRVLLRDDCIDVGWTSVNRRIGDVIMQPTYFQAIKLKPVGTGE